MRRLLLCTLAVVLAGPVLSGCLTISSGGRTEWAYGMTQLDVVAASGATGKGVVVAFLDTGINTHHPSMAHLADGDRDNGELIAFRDFLGSAQGPAAAFDNDGHGTHVSGILAAEGATRLDKLGGINLHGGAPDVQLVVARVCSNNACDPTVLPAAVNWAVAQGAMVISISLGGQFGLRDLRQQLDIDNAIQAAVDRGVVVIASAGNGGPEAEPGNRTTDVESPSNVQEVIAVGAVDSGGHVAGFSSRGDDANNPCRNLPIPTPLNGRCDPDQKPELVAPGVGILSAWTKDQYVRADGTSQACPFVTAAVALILEGKPAITNRAGVLHVKQVLVATALPVEGQHRPHDPAAGYGIVQAQAARLAYG